MNTLYKNILFLLLCLASSIVFASGPGFNDTSNRPLTSGVNPNFSVNVGIGSSAPGQTPVSGYVLTASDSAGDATWSAASSVGTNYWLNTAAAGNAGISTTNTVGIGTWVPIQPLHVNGHCVTGDTILRRRRRRADETHDYDECRIDAIEAGDEILSLNEETGLLEYQKAEALMDMGVKDIYKITTSSGKTIRTTGNHPYYVKEVSLQVTDFIHDGIFQVTKRVARKFYLSVLSKMVIKASGLGGEEVHFSRDGWEHLNDKERTRLNLMSRFMALPKLVPVLESPESMVEREKRGDIEFWALTGVIERVKIKVVLRSIKGGKKHFYSVVWQGEEKSGRNKNGAVSRLLQRHRGLVTPQLQEKYNTFTAQMSSLILKSTGKVFDVPSKAWSRFQPNCGVWRNVSDIKEGSYIAVATGISPISNHPNGRAKFERITKIELLPPQQVWDIQIANTRNFVGNDIIAHNTYITGNLGLGILPPSTGWTSTIEIIMNFSKNNEHIL